MTHFIQHLHTFIQPMLPKKFDENEWFTITITILVLLVATYLQKKKPLFFKTEVIAILLLNVLLSTLGDYTLGVPPYDYYDSVDKSSGELMDVLLQTIVYPVSLLIMMYIYVRYKPNKLMYAIVGAIVLFILEWISIKFFHLFTFKSWKAWYSFLFYLPIMWINIVFYNKLHTYIQKQIRQNG